MPSHENWGGGLKIFYMSALSNLEYINPWYQRYMYVHVCCTALMRPNQVETILSAVAYSLVPHDD